LKKSDTLIVLGDLIDRGTDSKGVLDTIILLLDSGFSIKCLLGNHEQMFLDSFKSLDVLNLWLTNGGDKTLFSFLTSSIEKIPLKYYNLIQSFSYHLEIDNYIFVHAGLNMNLENPFSDRNTMLWTREPRKYLNKTWLGNRKVIHGHSPKSEQSILTSILHNEEIISIDNGVFLTKPDFGSLCILQLETFQINFIK
jgi:serine/threonine protein phosphatase 1